MPLNSARFPYAASEGYSEESKKTNKYNCIAWAAGDTNNWWWPLPLEGFWPANIEREETITAFIKAFQSLGYVLCNDCNHELESGYEKIALYALGNEPTHAARQLENGRWVSKIGRSIDIEHSTTRAVEGPAYGVVVKVLKRVRPTQQ